VLALKSQKTHDLALRLRNDDISAFNILYWKYHTAIYANALKIIRDPLIAEDIVQDVFVALWEKRNTIDPKQDIAGWLFVVSHNKTVDQLKRKLRQTLAEKVLQSAVRYRDPIEEDITIERAVALERAVDQLSPQKRKAFELCKVKRITYEKAAEEMRISKHTVKEYLSEAIVSIKKYIGQHSTHSSILITLILLTDIFLSLLLAV